MSKKEKVIHPTTDALQERPAIASASVPDNPAKQLNESLEFEKLKLLYENVAEQNRFYLSWRHKLVAGHFATLAALFYASHTLYVSNCDLKKYAEWPALGITLISALFLGLDYRNQKLFKNAQNVGVAIEQKLGIAMYYQGELVNGLFSRHEKTVEGSFINRRFTHTVFIRTFCIICMIFGLYVFIFLK